MDALAAIGFAHPWLLAALLALPVLIWLLRVTPPAPRQQSFPAVRLLLDLPRRDETAARTPLWLLLLRIAAAGLVILGLARPVLPAAGTVGPGAGTLLLVVDDGWAAGQGWPLRAAAIETALDRAERAGQAAMLLATAPGERGEPPRVTAAMPAQEMRERVAALRPPPRAPARAAARRAVEQIGHSPGGVSVLWGSDGLAHGTGTEHRALADALAALGPLTVLAPPAASLPKALGAPISEPERIVARVAALPAPAEQAVTLLARPADGRTLARGTATLAAGERSAALPLPLPPELRCSTRAGAAAPSGSSPAVPRRPPSPCWASSTISTGRSAPSPSFAGAACASSWPARSRSSSCPTSTR